MNIIFKDFTKNNLKRYAIGIYGSGEKVRVMNRTEQ